MVDAAEYMSYFVDDPQTRVIVAFLEGIRSPRMFVDVALRARQAGKPLVVLKVGASERAQAATVAHTGSLAGADEVFDGLCEQFGILRVHDFDEMFDTANALSLLDGRLPQSNRLGSITMSGGQVSMLLDLASEAGLAFDELGADTRAALNKVLGRNPAISNPLDAGGTAGDDSVFADSLELIANDDNVDLLAVTSPRPRQLAAHRPDGRADDCLVAGDRETGDVPDFLRGSGGARGPRPAGRGRSTGSSRHPARFRHYRPLRALRRAPLPPD